MKNAILLCLWFYPTFLFSQAEPPAKTEDNTTEQLLESISENGKAEDTDYNDLVEKRALYAEHPVNLNKTNKQELEELQLLTDLQIVNLLAHISKYGKLITLYELQTIDEFDLQTIRTVLPYITVNDQFNATHFRLKELITNGKSSIVLRYGRVLEKQKGFLPIDSAALYRSKNARYIGSPDKLYARYRFNYGTTVSWGITAEKDQGELLFKRNLKFNYDWYNRSLSGNQKTGFDFYSAHFYLHNLRFVKSFVVGDYQAAFGQGLTMWTSNAFGKGTDILNVKKSATGVHAYTSVDENKFLRGIASSIGFKKLEFTGFYSRKHIDANITDTLESGEVAAVSSLQQTGVHSTPAEIADRHSILQTIYGGNISYRTNKLTIGITAMQYQLNARFNRALTYYNQFDFSSNRNYCLGLNYNFIFRNFNFFGEEARSKNGGLALVNGVLISLDPRISFTMIHRYYQRNYQNPVGNGFSEGTSASNEKGTYAGIVFKLTNFVSLTAYYDRFEFPWLKYQVNAPSAGNDYTAQINYTRSKKMDLYFRMRVHNKEKNTTDLNAPIDYIVPVTTANYRVNITYTVLPVIKLRNRIEFVNYHPGGEKTAKGFLVYQDIVYDKPGKKLSVLLRYALFHTDNYDARIYSYENDVPGSYSIPAYYSRGSRFYIMLDYNMTGNIELWVRYAQTFYDDKNVISRGSLTEIDGNTKSEIKLQMKIRF